MHGTAETQQSLRFSVIIPTYRRNESVARCLNRLMSDRQTLPPAEFEVIVTDDGSGDDNARLMVQNTYPWARWVAGPGRGPAANRNRGASQARAPWLVFTDDDCLPGPDWLSAFAKRIDGALDDCRVYEGRTTNGGSQPHGPFLHAPTNMNGGFLWSCNFAIERALFERLGGFDEHFPYPHLEDVDLRLRLEDARERYVFVPEASVAHPPRPVGSARRWALAQESSFYLARKRGVSVASVGLSWQTFARAVFYSVRNSRTLGEGSRVLFRTVIEAFWFALCLPRWLVRYSAKSAPAAPPSPEHGRSES